jgi:hypothetical protein
MPKVDNFDMGTLDFADSRSFIEYYNIKELMNPLLFTLFDYYLDLPSTSTILQNY